MSRKYLWCWRGLDDLNSPLSIFHLLNDGDDKNNDDDTDDDKNDDNNDDTDDDTDDDNNDDNDDDNDDDNADGDVGETLVTRTLPYLSFTSSLEGAVLTTNPLQSGWSWWCLFCILGYSEHFICFEEKSILLV